MIDEPRIGRLPPEQWSAELTEMIGAALPGLRPLSESPWLTTLAHNPALMKRFGPLANHLLFKGRLPARQRELLILRCGWLCQAPYEWSEHVAIAKTNPTFTAAEIERVIAGPDDLAWGPVDAALVRAVDELHRDSLVSDATWAVLAAEFDEATLLELLMVVGMYHLIAWMQNSARIALSEGSKGLAER